MSFQVGQKVVCVYANWIACCPKCVNFPVYRGIYTVRDILTGYSVRGLYGHGLVFEEILNPISPRGLEYSFKPTRFRPVVERKTDISIFKRMLKKQGADA